jgi:hypothetical protein
MISEASQLRPRVVERFHHNCKVISLDGNGDGSDGVVEETNVCCWHALAIIGEVAFALSELLQWSLNRIQNKPSGNKEKCISDREA